MNTLKYLLIIIFLTIFAVSCSLTSPIYNKSKELNKFDGQYNISFISNEICMANSIIEIVNNVVEGRITNVQKQLFIVKGNVSEKGELRIKSIETDSEETVEATGKISQDGIINGTYKVGKRQGKFLGFCFFTQSKDMIVKKYDGDYQVEFYRNDQQMANIQAKIIDGEFHTFITTKNDEIYRIDGKISNDGKIILNTIFSNMGHGITVSGTINEKGLINGEYYTFAGNKGLFSGKRIQ